MNFSHYDTEHLLSVLHTVPELKPMAVDELIARLTKLKDRLDEIGPWEDVAQMGEEDNWHPADVLDIMEYLAEHGVFNLRGLISFIGECSDMKEGEK